MSVEATAFGNSFSQNFEHNERPNLRHIHKHLKGAFLELELKLRCIVNTKWIMLKSYNAKSNE